MYQDYLLLNEFLNDVQQQLLFVQLINQTYQELIEGMILHIENEQQYQLENLFCLIEFFVFEGKLNT